MRMLRPGEEFLSSKALIKKTLRKRRKQSLKMVWRKS
jgi:hypothetical protein